LFVPFSHRSADFAETAADRRLCALIC
jgi:hypothetical protein